jgi:CheY-like chemotaxis protein
MDFTRAEMARILVADDAPAALDVLDDVLALEGHEVLRTISGQEAIRKFAESAPDLAVLDSMMPAMDGPVVPDTIRRTGGDVR